MRNKIVMITGVSAGIGKACAEVFAEAGAKLILLARRKEKLTELSEVVRKNFGTSCYIIECDVSDMKTLSSSIRNMPPEWQQIDVLINNAGLARGFNKIQDGEISDWEEMIDTNIKGLLFVSRLILPGMIERAEGHVINIASIAGRQVYPAGNVYCATKHAVKALSEGMSIDLNGTGVKVTNIDPGLVETEFASVRFHGDEDKAAGVYMGYTPLTGRDVAETVLFAATRPKHVMIQDLSVTPTDQANTYIVNKKL